MNSLNFTFTHVPPVFKRKSHVLLAIFDNNEIILSRKNIYPANVYRLLGGGIDAGETPIEAAIRELKEETLVTRIEDDFIHLKSFNFNLTESSSGTEFEYAMELFSLNLNREEIIPSDDINEIKIFDKFSFKSNLNLMNSLSPELINTKDDHYFSWADWGKIFSLPHTYIYQHWN